MSYHHARTHTHTHTAQLTHELSEKEEKVGELRHALAMLDQDHDHLVCQADKKDESIAGLTAQLEQRKASLETMEARLTQLHADLKAAESEQQSKQLEASTVQQELDNMRGQLEGSREQVVMLTTQISQLRNDLITMTKVRKTPTSPSHLHP